MYLFLSILFIVFAIYNVFDYVSKRQSIYYNHKKDVNILLLSFIFIVISFIFSQKYYEDEYKNKKGYYIEGKFIIDNDGDYYLINQQDKMIIIQEKNIEKFSKKILDK